jgi:hypothetical protein
MNAGEDLTASGRIPDGRGFSGQVGFDGLLKLKGELGVRHQVRIPVSAARSPCDIHVSINIVEPDLCAAELSGFPTPGDDVDGAVAFQGVLYPFIHQEPPIEIISA